MTYSVASAASSYVYTSSRTLYSLANAGQAPKVLRRLNRKGTPWVCVLVSIALACLSYLSVSAGTNKVLTWFINLVTASQLLNWIVRLKTLHLCGDDLLRSVNTGAESSPLCSQFMSLTWIGMNRAIKKQGLDRKTFLPHTSRFQPYAAWYALIMASLVLFFSGYELFLPGKFAADSFIFTCELKAACETRVYCGVRRARLNSKCALSRHRGKKKQMAWSSFLPLCTSSGKRSSEHLSCY